MKTLADARVLARTMVDIGKSLGRETIAVLSDMNQPLGLAVGNSLEVLEAMQALQGTGPSDLVDVCLELGAWMLVAGGKVDDVAEGKEMLNRQLKNGAAWNKFLEFVEAQGGDVEAVKDGSLSLAPLRAEVKAEASGYVESIDALGVGLAAMLLGAGRQTKESSIDSGAGVLLQKKQGDRVEVGDTLMLLYSSEQTKLDNALNLTGKLVKIGPNPVVLNAQTAEVIR